MFHVMTSAVEALRAPFHRCAYGRDCWGNPSGYDVVDANGHIAARNSQCNSDRRKPSENPSGMRARPHNCINWTAPGAAPRSSWPGRTCLKRPMNAATVDGSAGNATSATFRHHAWKIRQSDSYPRQVPFEGTCGP